MNNTSELWQRMMRAAKNAASRKGFPAAATIRKAWTEWYHRQLCPLCGKANSGKPHTACLQHKPYVADAIILLTPF